MTDFSPPEQANPVPHRLGMFHIPQELRDLVDSRPDPVRPPQVKGHRPFRKMFSLFGLLSALVYGDSKEKREKERQETLEKERQLEQWRLAVVEARRRAKDTIGDVLPFSISAAIPGDVWDAEYYVASCREYGVFILDSSEPADFVRCDFCGDFCGGILHTEIPNPHTKGGRLRVCDTCYPHHVW